MRRKHCEAILLYYEYVDLTSHQQDVKAWYLNVCKGLDLKGRVRVAKDGINCTVMHTAQPLMYAAYTQATHRPL